MLTDRKTLTLAAVAGLLALVLLGSCSDNRGEPFVPIKPDEGPDSTKVEGYIDGGTWLLSKSPYYVVKPVTLLANRTLTIQPGVLVIFTRPGLNLAINGKLLAVGTAAKGITFRATSGQGFEQQPGDWGSLIFSNSRGNRLAYVNISCANVGIIATDSDLLIEHSIVARNKVDGLQLTRTALTLTDSEVKSNGQYGLWLSLCDAPLNPVRIVHCSIGNNVWGGIWSINSAPEVRRSDIMGNGVYYDDDISKGFSSGAHFEGLPGMTLPVFSSCNIEGNLPCDVRNLMGAGSVVVADSNYWGAATTYDMNWLSNLDSLDAPPDKGNCMFNVRKICDAQDSLGAVVPTVTFCHWADTAFPNFSPSAPSPDWNPPRPLAR